jgi:prophage tail gpP-like protein
MTTVYMEVDGQPFENFVSIAVSRSLDDFSGSFNITATDADAGEFPIKVGSSVKVAVDGVPIVTGYVDYLNPNVSARDHNVEVAGRDVTADLIDSTLGAAAVELNPTISMSDVINKTQNAIGLSQPIVLEETVSDFGKEDIISCEAQQSCFDLIEQHARKKQVLVTTNGNGDIVVTRGQPVDTGLKFINLKDDINGENNLLESRASFDWSNRYGRYVVVSQSNLVGANNFGVPSLEDVVNVQSGEVFDSEVRASRIMTIIAENPSDQSTTLERAKWESNIRKARSIEYYCTIDGVVNPLTLKPYELNGLAQVVDEDCKINAMMLIKGITHNINLYDGHTTQFCLTHRDAYTLQVSEPVAQSRTNDTGGGFTFE